MSLELGGLIVLTAFLSAMLYVILRYFTRFTIDTIQALTANYLTASLTAFLFSDFSKGATLLPGDFYIYAGLTGTLFIGVFYTAALCAQRCGVSLTSVAGKTSMVIPVIVGIWLFKDSFSFFRLSGVIIALLAVAVSSMKSGNSGKEKSHCNLLPPLLFIGSGAVDTSIKLAQNYLLNAQNEAIYTALVFGSAGLIGTVWTLFRAGKGHPLRIKNIAAGALLGLFNYFSLYYLIRCLDFEGAESSVIFASVNMLVVVISTLLSIFLFSERPERKTYTGIALALLAIFLLTNG